MMELTDLAPYKSLQLIQIDKSVDSSFDLKEALKSIKDSLDIRDKNNDDQKPKRQVVREPQIKNSGEDEDLNHGFFTYEHYKPVSWIAAPEMYDRENHLILLTRHTDHPLLTIYLSETNRRASLRKIFTDDSTVRLEYFDLVDPEVLNTAFFDGPVQTLWLSGIHRRVPVKADSKMLSGPDLESALDPINDQTFYQSSARTRSNEVGIVGLSPKKSCIWTKQSKDWADYKNGIRNILEILGRTKNDIEQGDIQEETRPISCLANVYEFEDFKDEISDPYDILIRSPELQNAEQEIEENERDLIETLSYQTQFNVKNEHEVNEDQSTEISKPDKIVSEVSYKGNKIGDLTIDIDANDPESIEIRNAECELYGDIEILFSVKRSLF